MSATDQPKSVVSVPLTTPDRTPAIGGAKPYGWASEWVGIAGVSLAFHDTEQEAVENAKWMAGRSFPVFAPPTTEQAPASEDREALRESYVKNCLIIRRDDDDADFLFLSDDRGIIVRLDSYAIIPRADYERLIALPTPEGG